MGQREGRQPVDALALREVGYDASSVDSRMADDGRTGTPTHRRSGPGGGTYYANSPAGGTSGTAMRKFVDSLPGLGAANANNLGQFISVAHPDTLTYPGSDY